jgi:DNA-binding NarL/FixJ family response regulator
MILSAQPDMTVVGEAANGTEAIDLTAEFRPDVVLMDIHMPELDGVAATRRIVAAETGARVLVLSTFDLDEYVVAALRAGAGGFLPKDVSPEELVDAIRIVHRGEAAVAPRLLTRLIGAFVGTARSPSPVAPPGLNELTDREREILVLIARGRSNAEIARSLAISMSTVKNHVTSVFAKIHARDRAQAVIVAYEAGLVAPGEA